MPDISSDKIAPGAVDRCFETFRQNATRVIANPGVEEVHDLRTSIRRLRQALALCEKQPKQIQKSLNQLRKLAGPIRDSDITAQFVAERGMSQERQAAASQLVARLRKFPHATSKGLKITEASAARRLAKLRKRFKKLGNKASCKGASGKALHLARIATKKLRYALEIVPSEDFPHGRLDKLQDLLGEINDQRIIREITDAQKPKDKIRRFRKLWRREFSV
jgi:CHAD domain-containing protein